MVVQSPLEYPAILTPMGPRAVMALVDAIAQAGVTLPGVNGDAATAASFAGQWSERCKSAATPLQGMRPFFTTLSRRGMEGSSLLTNSGAL